MDMEVSEWRYISIEERSLKKLYHALIEGDDRRDILTQTNWNYLEQLVITELYQAHSNGGMPAIQAFLADLSQNEDFNLRRLAALLLADPGKVEIAGTLLANVQPQPISWLWYPRLALGKITMLDGDPGLGKSLIGADLGARITTGANMPDGKVCATPGGVVVIMPEDTLQDTIYPRFARAGADLRKVIDVSMVPVDPDEYEMAEETSDWVARRPFQLPNDLDYLESAIKRVHAKLVYIDPVMALLAGGTNTNKDDDVRTLLLPLRKLIEKYQVACVMVRHMTKTRGENPLMAGMGSIAFIGMARSGLMVVRDAMDKTQMVLSHIKSNIGPLAPGITYSICNDEATGDDRPYIAWGKLMSSDVPDVLSAPRKETVENMTRILNLLNQLKPLEMSMQDIADFLPEMTPATIKTALKRLHERGEIAKSPNGLYHVEGEV